MYEIMFVVSTVEFAMTGSLHLGRTPVGTIVTYAVSIVYTRFVIRLSGDTSRSAGLLLAVTKKALFRVNLTLMVLCM